MKIVRCSDRTENFRPAVKSLAPSFTFVAMAYVAGLTVQIGTANKPWCCCIHVKLVAAAWSLDYTCAAHPSR